MAEKRLIYVSYLPLGGIRGVFSDTSFPASILERASRYRCEADRVSFLASHQLQRLVAASFIGVEPRDVNIRHSSTGRPEIRVPGVHGLQIPQITASRRRGLIAVAVSNAPTIGIDVELDCEIEEAMDLLSPFLAQESLARISLRDGNECNLDFVSSWTLIEACGKAVGDGLLAFDGDLTIRQVAKRRYSLTSSRGSWQGLSRRVHNEYVIAVAWTASDERPEIRWLCGEDLFK